jgi:Mg2+ and Co2+ transporter CorA
MILRVLYSIRLRTDIASAVLPQVFGIHPLTTEDILLEETREKIELFRNYYLVCFRSFDQDPYSQTYLEPLNMYIIVFREGTLSVSSASVLLNYVLRASLTRIASCHVHSSISEARLTLKTSDAVSSPSKTTFQSPPTGSRTRSSTTSPTPSAR